MTTVAAGLAKPTGSERPISRRDRQWIFLTAAAAVLAATLEGALCFALIADPARMGAVLAAHGGIAVAMALWARLLWRKGKLGRIFLLFVLMTTVTGPVGASGTLLAAGLLHFFRRRATPFEIWYASLSPEPQTSPTLALYEQIVRRKAMPDDLCNVAPFAGVMSTGSARQKETVLGLIADNFRPSFAPALRAALNDPEPTVRVLAATASARIENCFLERSLLLEDLRSNHAGDIHAMLELGRHYDEYANTGLLDPGRADGARRQALELYECADRLQPGDAGLAKAIGRLLLRLDRSEEAVIRLAPLVIRGSASMEVLAWYVESLYRSHHFAALRQTCERYKNELVQAIELSGEFREVVILWADAGPEGSRHRHV